MRKYIQLCLILVAVTCFVLMAMYERKYSHLETVIRFMQWTTSPSKLDCQSVNCRGDRDAAPNFHWLEAAPELYTYSAFLLRNETTLQIISLRHSKSDNNRVMCSFFHEDGADVSNAYARSVPIRQFGDWNLNLLSCPAGKEKGHEELNGVALSITDSTPEWMLNVLTPNMSNTSGKPSLVFCVKPLSVGFSDVARILEFVELAQQAGVERLVFYHRGLGTKVRQFLSREVKKRLIQLLPFYLPLGTPTELIDSAAQLDCFLRHTLQQNVKIMSIGMNDFFVTAQGRNVLSSLPTGFSGLVTFKTQMYCMEYHDDIVARTLHFPFLTLRKTKRLKDFTIRSLLVIEAVDDARHLKVVKESLDPQKMSVLPSTSALKRNGVILKHYGKCRSNRISAGLLTDSSMMKFKDQLFQKLQLFQ